MDIVWEDTTEAERYSTHNHARINHDHVLSEEHIKNFLHSIFCRYYGHGATSRVMDIGAGDGDFGLKLLAKNLADVVIFYEPGEAMYEMLRDNTENSCYKNRTMAFNEESVSMGSAHICTSHRVINQIETLDELRAHFDFVNSVLGTDGLYFCSIFDLRRMNILKILRKFKLINKNGRRVFPFEIKDEMKWVADVKYDEQEKCTIENTFYSSSCLDRIAQEAGLKITKTIDIERHDSSKNKRTPMSYKIFEKNDR